MLTTGGSEKRRANGKCRKLLLLLSIGVDYYDSEGVLSESGYIDGSAKPKWTATSEQTTGKKQQRRRTKQGVSLVGQESRRTRTEDVQEAHEHDKCECPCLGLRTQRRTWTWGRSGHWTAAGRQVGRRESTSLQPLFVALVGQIPSLIGESMK